MHTLKTSFLVLATLATALPACTLQAGTSLTPRTYPTRRYQRSPTPPAPAKTTGPETSPAGNSFPQSGGLSPETGEDFILGNPIEGIAGDEARYYHFDAIAGQNVAFTVYSELVRSSIGGSNLRVRLLAADGEALGGVMTATRADATSPEFDKDAFSFVSEKDQPVLMRITCRGRPVHYKILTATK